MQSSIYRCLHLLSRCFWRHLYVDAELLAGPVLEARLDHSAMAQLPDSIHGIPPAAGALGDPSQVAPGPVALRCDQTGAERALASGYRSISSAINSTVSKHFCSSHRSGGARGSADPGTGSTPSSRLSDLASSLDVSSWSVQLLWRLLALGFGPVPRPDAGGRCPKW